MCLRKERLRLGLALFGAGFFSDCVGVGSAGGGFEFTFAEAVALAFDDEEIDVMSKTIDQGGDAGGIGKDRVPVFKGAISSNNQ